MDYKNYYHNQLQTGGRLDYKTYYENQLQGAGFPVFSGYHNQRGHGFGGYIAGWLKSILWPSMKTFVKPIIKHGGEVVKTELIKTAANMATDAIAGKKFTDSAKDNLSTAVGNLAQKATNALTANTQKGEGYKKKRKVKHSAEYTNHD